MSTHILDVSGARALTSTVNDPVATRAQTPAKPGDDAAVTLGGFREIRLKLAPGARIQRRRYIRRSTRLVDGRPVKKAESDEYEIDETPYEELVLVLASGATVFGRTSFSDEERAAAEAENRTVFEQTPSSSVVAKRWGDEQHFLESGELLEEFDLTDYLPRSPGTEG